MEHFKSHSECLSFIEKKLGRHIRLATPLGIGKPNQLLNFIYDQVKSDSQRTLQIFTGLSLDFDKPQGFFQEKFLQPFFDRHYGADYPHLHFVQDLKKNQVPTNIKIHEFYLQAGAMLKSEHSQRNYISLNYTHVPEGIFQLDVNLVIQLVARRADGKLSLSSNPDLTLDVCDIFRSRKKDLLMIAVVHPDLAFLGGDAEVDPEFFDALLETSEVNHQLFSIPKTILQAEDQMIGFLASHLVKDDGTLQIGIGSLADALVHSLICRQTRNYEYKKLGQSLLSRQKSMLEHSVFDKGLYGTSELLMDGFMHLRKAGILKREVLDSQKNKIFLHGAFYLGSQEFYDWLRHLSSEDYGGLSMTRVSKVNDLYDNNEMALRKQRKNARFFNTCMSVTLLGGAASDTLEDGLVLSGVGGQYNFVAMAHELPDSYSALMLRSVRTKNGRRSSNVLVSHGQQTIPRHLRDVVITEYGIAFLKGASDESVIQSLIEISDSEFQMELVAWAKKNHKISADYQIPEYAKHNTSEKIKNLIQENSDLFPSLPFGSDFTKEELKIGKALKVLEKSSSLEKIGIFFRGLTVNAQDYETLLNRMELKNCRGLKEKFYRTLLLGAL